TRRLAETLQELRPLLRGDAALLAAAARAAGRIPDAWDRTVALGRRVEQVLSGDVAAAPPAVRAAVYLGALAGDVLSQHASAPPALDWPGLASPRRDEVLADLLSAGMAGGLRLTGAAAAVLDDLDRAGVGAVPDRLVPYLERPEPSALPFVLRWLAAGPGPLHDVAALMLLEHGRVTLETVGTAIALL